MEQFLSNLVATLTSPAVGGVIVVLAGLMLGDLATGVGAALRRPGSGLFGSEFEPLYVGEFIRSHILGRLLPIVGIIVLSVITPPLVIVAGLAVTAYTAETLASIKENLELAVETDEERDFRF